VQFEGGGKILEIVVVREFVADGHVKQDRCFVGPASGHVAHGVPSTAQHKKRDSKALHKLDTLSVALEAQAEAPKSVTPAAETTADCYFLFNVTEPEVGEQVPE